MYRLYTFVKVDEGVDKILKHYGVHSKLEQELKHYLDF